MKFFRKYFKKIKKQRKYEKLCKCNDIQILKLDLSKIDLKITGKNNIIKIGKINSCNGKLLIHIEGDNNLVEIGEGLKIGVNLNIHIGVIHPNLGAVENVKCYIGKDCSFESCDIITFNSNSEINIGNSCMVSYNVEIYHTDGHPILDLTSLKLINKVKKLTIGNHVWLGKNVTILKNSQIADDCIVGWGE